MLKAIDIIATEILRLQLAFGIVAVPVSAFAGNGKALFWSLMVVGGASFILFLDLYLRKESHEGQH